MYDEDDIPETTPEMQVEMDRFSKFCEQVESTLPGILAGISEHVTTMMKNAGEDPSNAVLHAIRTHQFCHSLNSAAERRHAKVTSNGVAP